MTRAHRRRLLVVSGVVSSAIALACGPGFLDGISGGAPAPAAAVDAEPTIDAGVDARTCVPARLPERPTGADGPGDLTLRLAFERLRADTVATPDPAADGGSNGPAPVGLDLDDTCTCEGPERDSCERPSASAPACDGPRGEDKATAGLLDQVITQTPFLRRTFATDAIREGRYTVLVDIRGWSGEPDDPKVTVALRLSTDFDREESGRDGPLFDGKDVWTVDPQSVAGGGGAIGANCRAEAVACTPLVTDTNAYVRGGRLVARPRLADPNRPVLIAIRTGVGPLNFELSDFVLTGRLEGAPGGPYRLEGEVAGRVEAGRYLTSVANLQYVEGADPTLKPLCGNGAFVAIQGILCAARDIAAPGADNTGAPCSYLSTAFAFGASEAAISTVRDKDAGGAPCPVIEHRCE